MMEPGPMFMFLNTFISYCYSGSIYMCDYYLGGTAGDYNI